MKKVFWSLIACIILLSLKTNAAITSTETFQRAFDEWVITSYRWETSKTDVLTREKAAPLLVNYINNVARKEYRGNLCSATDIPIAEEIYQDDLRTLCNFWILRWTNNKIQPLKELNKQAATALVMRIIDWDQKEKKSWPWAYNYYTRARELGYYGVPNIMKDANKSVTVEEFINFLYSTKHPFETIKKDTSKTVNYKSNWEFQSSRDALNKLEEILKSEDNNYYYHNY